MMFKRILLATDGSPIIERVVLFAGHVARVEQAEVIVMHAYDLLNSRYEHYAGYEALTEQYRALAQSVVDDAVTQLREDGIQARGELRAGPAADAIIAAAIDYDISLIVMGTRGSSNLQDILGSVSAHVLRYARCPVLQVP
jgi:nucleotide-binding universal stress UspA family protein